jgi:hypothetical protein
MDCANTEPPLKMMKWRLFKGMDAHSYHVLEPQQRSDLRAVRVKRRRPTPPAMGWLESRPLREHVIHRLSRLAFRGIYFPQISRKDWVKILFQNRGPSSGRDHLCFEDPLD